jgi:16S rRNA processing protein RimM
MPKKSFSTSSVGDSHINQSSNNLNELHHSKIELKDVPMDLIEIGRVSGPFGVRGQVKIYLHHDGEVLLSEKKWYMQFNTETYHLNIKEARRHQDTHIVASTHIFTTPEEIEKFRHAGIFIEKSRLPKPAKNEYYWSDLIGKKVYNISPDATNPSYLGMVDHLLETPGQDLLSIATEENQAKHHQLLIPFIDPYIKHVDLVKSEIMVEWHF